MMKPEDDPNEYPYIVWVFSAGKKWNPVMFEDLYEAIGYVRDCEKFTVLTKVAEWMVTFGYGEAA